MSSITYGSYSFPTPHPFVSLDDSPVYINGTLDHINKKISLIGRFTGSSLEALNLEKRKLISGLSTGYLTLSIDSDQFQYCKPTTISFQDSNLSSVLPYSIEMEAFESKAFSKYFGVSDPVDSWSYQEQNNRIVNATHTISAIGKKVDANSPLQNARNFVTGNLNGFKQFSTFFTGQSGFLRSTTEEIDEFKGSYSVTQNYVFSDSRTPITNSGIVTAKTQISYSKGQPIQVTVNGNILGSIDGPLVNESMITAAQAKDLAIQSMTKSKSNFETGLYSILNKDPISQSFAHNETSNTIDFSFTFANADDYRPNGPTNNYTVNVTAAKDTNNITVAVNGSITYIGSDNLYTGGAVESSPRFLAINSYFSGLNIFDFARQGYSDFLLMNTGYETGTYLNKDEVEQQVSKNPYDCMIEYNYVYTNRTQLSENLINCELNISDNKPIKLEVVKNGINGYPYQTIADKTLGEMSVEATSLNTSGFLQELSGVADSLFAQKGSCVIKKSESFGIATDSISYSIAKYYKP